jgi:hypothetical protein
MDRRNFLRQVGLGVVSVAAAGGSILLTPREARAQDAPLTVLSRREGQLLEALGEALVPGAKEAGLVHFVDYHLGLPPADCLLMLRYLDVPPPFAPFYQSCIANADSHSTRTFGKSMDGLSESQLEELIASIAQDSPTDWQGYPSPLFYFTLRADAVDVVYGTEDGFEKLGVPYMAHIAPPSQW